MRHVAAVRAFLWMGTAFFVLALFTVIWHAAVDLEQTWLWAVTGIVAGVAIIAVFAIFEKKRDEVLAAGKAEAMATVIRTADKTPS